MRSEEIKALIEKYLAGSATDEEIVRLRAWYRRVDDAEINMDFDTKAARSRIKQELFTKLALPFDLDAKETAPHSVENMSPKVTSIWKNNRYKLMGMAAVSLLLILLTGLYWASQEAKRPVMVTRPIEIAPGRHGAVLYLSTGKAYMLDTVRDGLIATDGHLKIIREGDGIRYEAIRSASATPSLFNRIMTDYGRTWHVTLPDGSRVWLNALSSIRYPLSFSTETRTVSLTGEGYFEVVHNAEMPFQVHIGKTIIEDIGTSFNINGYEDEPSLKTTLIEGSIQVKDNKASVVMRPGQQAIITDSIELLDKVNTASEIAWKDGYFQFQSASLQEVMRQISRWYHVDVEYKGDIAPELFMGKIPKDMPASKVLNILEQAGVRFDIVAAPVDHTGGKIVVSPS